MKTILLFYPSTWPRGARGRIPYALLYLERMVRRPDIEVIIIDEQVTPDYLPVIERVKGRLLLAGVSAMTGNQIRGGIQFSKIVKEMAGRQVPVVWGGWHPTLLPENVLNESFVDFVVSGQGEKAFLQLVEAVLSGNSTEGIAGTGYKLDGRYVINDPDPFADINIFPKVNYEIIDISNYTFRSSYSEKCIGYFCSHGCPYNCAFCCLAKVFKRKWYRKNIDEIIEDIAYFKAKTGIDSVTFDDDNFFVNRDFALELSRRMIDSKLGLLWDTSAHAGSFLRTYTDEDIELFYQSGCRQIYVGAESGDQAILDLISKGTSVEDNIRFVELLKKHKIMPMFSAMVGFPVNGGKDFNMTLDMIRRAKLVDRTLRARVFFYTPYPGTDLYNLALQEGFVPPTKLESWPDHTLRKFKAPWVNDNLRLDLEIFANFFFPLCNPDFYRTVPVKSLQPVVWLINKIFFPMAYLRFRYNFFRWPLEALLFLYVLRLFNRITGNSFSLGYETYLD